MLGRLGRSWRHPGLLGQGTTGYYIESSSNEKQEFEFTVRRLLISPAPSGDFSGLTVACPQAEQRVSLL